MEKTQPEAARRTLTAQLLQAAVELLNAENPVDALDKIIEAKSQRVFLRDLDYVRGFCFLRLNRIDEAKEALREELRFHPDNTQAEELLTQINAATTPPIHQDFGDPEFGSLLTIIRPYTMLSNERLYNLFKQARDLCRRNVAGNFVECGVAAGGSSALLAYVIKQHSTQPRKLFSLDSFSGMPAATDRDTHLGITADGTGWGTGTCAAPVQSLLNICERLAVADVVHPIPGYFEDTVPVEKVRLGTIALLHLDGDWYSSTKVVLENLYDQVTNGGILQIDDFGFWDGCREAIVEFETARNLSFPLERIDDTGVWFQKA